MNLDFNPQNVADPDELAYARDQWRRGALVEAEELYAALLVGHSSDPRVWLEAGKFSDELGRSGDAVGRLRRAIAAAADQPLLEEAQAALARALMRRGDYAAAGGIWWRQTRTKYSTPAWSGLAACAHFAGHTRLVRRCARMLRGRSTPHERRQMAAEAWIWGVGADVDIRPPRAETQAAASPLIELLRSSQRSLRRHTARHPGRADAHFHMGVCAEALGEREAARKAAQAALNLNTRYAAAASLAMRLAA